MARERTKRPVPVEEEARKRREEARALEGYDEDDPLRSVRQRGDDTLANALGQAAVEDLTTGGHAAAEHDDDVPEDELGGPFVETTGREELGFDDESEPDEVEAEPMPRAVGGAAEDEDEDEDEDDDDLDEDTEVDTDETGGRPSGATRPGRR